jgi:hypothetical protein
MNGSQLKFLDGTIQIKDRVFTDGWITKRQQKWKIEREGQDPSAGNQAEK